MGGQSGRTAVHLFSDIEGSTRLWESYPEAMQAAIQRHDAILDNTIEAHGGRVIDHAGDGVFAVFEEGHPLHAALAIQRHIQDEDWAEIDELRIRIGLHAGQVPAGTDDPRGPLANRTARIMDAGHGGQILVTPAVLDVQELPSEAWIADLGTHELKDLTDPQPIYQLNHPELAWQAFPALTSLSAQPNNLPTQLTSFVGRQTEIAEVEELLGSTRMLTLTGMGGSGKSRLAVQIGAEQVGAYPDGVWLVELAPLSEPEFLPQQVADALSVREESNQTLTDTLARHLADKTTLLILDNCEHVVDEVAELAERLLHQCPDLIVLATSQIAIEIAGEQTYQVPPMTLPASAASPEAIFEYDSVRLFVDRARLSQPTFELTAETGPSVLEICDRLDGVPLAIELAAARVRAMPVSKIARRLDDRFRLLKSSSRSMPSRHRTLQATLDWSHELLSESEQRLFRRLAVFAGGFTLEAAEQVCADEALDELDVLDLLERLVTHSLVQLRDERYGMLESVRQYAATQLEAADEATSFHERHLRFVSELAAEAEPALKGQDQADWLERLEVEHGNIRAALDWAFQSGYAEQALQLASALGRFWLVRGHLTEGRSWLEPALEKQAEAAPEVRMKALMEAGVLANYQGEYDEARSHLNRSLTLAREYGDEWVIARVLNVLGIVELQQARLTKASEQLHASLDIVRSLSDAKLMSSVLNNLGGVEAKRGVWSNARDYFREYLDHQENPFSESIAKLNVGIMEIELGNADSARDWLETSLALGRHISAKQVIGLSLSHLGRVDLLDGEEASSLERGQHALDIAYELGDNRIIETTLKNLANTALFAEQTAWARQLYLESLHVSRTTGDEVTAVNTLTGLATVFHREGRHEEAAQLLGAVSDALKRLGTALEQVERTLFAESQAATREALAENAYEDAYQTGQKLAFDEVIELATGNT